MNTIKRLNEKRHEDGGFTLVELLVVIVILGILSAVVVFAVGGITNKGQSSACASEKRALETAEEAYYAQQATPGYATEAALVSGKYIRSASTNYDITNIVAYAAGPPEVKADYTITAVTAANGGKCA